MNSPYWHVLPGSPLAETACLPDLVERLNALGIKSARDLYEIRAEELLAPNGLDRRLLQHLTAAVGLWTRATSLYGVLFEAAALAPWAARLDSSALLLDSCCVQALAARGVTTLADLVTTTRHPFQAHTAASLELLMGVLDGGALRERWAHECVAWLTQARSLGESGYVLAQPRPARTRPTLARAPLPAYELPPREQIEWALTLHPNWLLARNNRLTVGPRTLAELLDEVARPDFLSRSSARRRRAQPLRSGLALLSEMGGIEAARRIQWGAAPVRPGRADLEVLGALIAATTVEEEVDVVAKLLGPRELDALIAQPPGGGRERTAALVERLPMTEDQFHNHRTQAKTALNQTPLMLPLTRTFVERVVAEGGNQANAWRNASARVRGLVPFLAKAGWFGPEHVRSNLGRVKGLRQRRGRATEPTRVALTADTFDAVAWAERLSLGWLNGTRHALREDPPSIGALRDTIRRATEGVAGLGPRRVKRLSQDLRRLAALDVEKAVRRIRWPDDPEATVDSGRASVETLAALVAAETAEAEISVLRDLLESKYWAALVACGTEGRPLGVTAKLARRWKVTRERARQIRVRAQAVARDLPFVLPHAAERARVLARRVGSEEGWWAGEPLLVRQMLPTLARSGFLGPDAPALPDAPDWAKELPWASPPPSAANVGWAFRLDAGWLLLPNAQVLAGPDAFPETVEEVVAIAKQPRLRAERYPRMSDRTESRLMAGLDTLGLLDGERAPALIRWPSQPNAVVPSGRASVDTLRLLMAARSPSEELNVVRALLRPREVDLLRSHPVRDTPLPTRIVDRWSGEWGVSRQVVTIVKKQAWAALDALPLVLPQVEWLIHLPPRRRAPGRNGPGPEYWFLDVVTSAGLVKQPSAAPRR